MEEAWRKRVRLPHVLRRLLLSPFYSSAPTPTTSSTNAVHESSDPKGEMLAFSGLFSSCPASRESFHLNFFLPSLRSFRFSLFFIFFFACLSARWGDASSWKRVVLLLILQAAWSFHKINTFSGASSDIHSSQRTGLSRWRHYLSSWQHTLIPRYPISRKLPLVSTLHSSAVYLFALICLVCFEAIADSGVKVIICQHQHVILQHGHLASSSASVSMFW